jgi:hypothetical protein
MATNSEEVLASVQAGRRADSNAYPDQFREYELASAPHATPNELDFGPAFADILAAGAPMPPVTCGFGPRSPLPTGIFQDAALRNLDLWVRRNVPPPPGKLLDFVNGVQVLDTYGNAVGGVRSSYVDVPTAHWFVGSAGAGLCFLLGYVHPFDEAEMKPLYPDHGVYAGKVIADIFKLVVERYITLEDGLEIINHARQSGVPDTADIPSDLPDNLYLIDDWK